MSKVTNFTINVTQLQFSGSYDGDNVHYDVLQVIHQNHNSNQIFKENSKAKNTNASKLDNATIQRRHNNIRVFKHKAIKSNKKLECSVFKKSKSSTRNKMKTNEKYFLGDIRNNSTSVIKCDMRDMTVECLYCSGLSFKNESRR